MSPAATFPPSPAAALPARPSTSRPLPVGLRGSGKPLPGSASPEAPSPGGSGSRSGSEPGPGGSPTAAPGREGSGGSPACGRQVPGGVQPPDGTYLLLHRLSSPGSGSFQRRQQRALGRGCSALGREGPAGTPPGCPGVGVKPCKWQIKNQLNGPSGAGGGPELAPRPGEVFEARPPRGSFPFILPTWRWGQHSSRSCHRGLWKSALTHRGEQIPARSRK